VGDRTSFQRSEASVATAKEKQRLAVANAGLLDLSHTEQVISGAIEGY